jgi:hypothetical protein
LISFAGHIAGASGRLMRATSQASSGTGQDFLELGKVIRLLAIMPCISAHPATGNQTEFQFSCHLHPLGCLHHDDLLSSASTWKHIILR